MPDDTLKRFTQLMRRGGADREFLFSYIDNEFGHLFREQRDGEAFFAFINGIGNMGQTEEQTLEFVRLLLREFYSHLPQPVQQSLVRVCSECNFDPDSDVREREPGSNVAFLPQELEDTEMTTDDAATDSKQLAADLYAGGEGADTAITFLLNQNSKQFRTGGDHAIELFCDWVGILLEGNPGTARKFSARALPMFPDKAQAEAMVRSLSLRMLKGGQDGADAATSIFNAMEQANGADRARTLVRELFSGIPPDTQKSINRHLTSRIRDAIR